LENLVKELLEKRKRIASLETELKIEQTNYQTTSMKLADFLERDRARLNDLVTATVQTEPLVEDVSTQTDFIVPPVYHKFLLSK